MAGREICPLRYRQGAARAHFNVVTDKAGFDRFLQQGRRRSTRPACSRAVLLDRDLAALMVAFNAMGPPT